MARWAFLILLPLTVAGESSCEAGSETCASGKGHDSSALLQKAVNVHRSIEEGQEQQRPDGNHDDDAPPPCFAPCKDKVPSNCEPSCADFEAFIAPGGCASNCDNATKHEGAVAFCGHHDHDHHGRDDQHDDDAPPPCVMPCMDMFKDHEPSCGDFEHLVGPGGCASTCDNATLGMMHAALCEEKDHDHHSHGGDAPPPCVMPCMDMFKDHEPSCGDFEHLVGPGGCASSCDNATIGMLHFALCEEQDHDHHGHDDHHDHHHDDHGPDCTDACQGKIPSNCEPTCADFEAFIAPGGCASSCDNATIAMGRHEFCDHHDHEGDHEETMNLINLQNVWAKHRPAKLMTMWAANVRKSAERSVRVKRTPAKLMAMLSAKVRKSAKTRSAWLKRTLAMRAAKARKSAKGASAWLKRKPVNLLAMWAAKK